MSSKKAQQSSSHPKKVKEKLIKTIAVLVLLEVIIIAGFGYYESTIGATSGGIGLMPAESNNEYPNWFLYDLKPGDQVNGMAVVSNSSANNEAPVELFALDAIEGTTPFENSTFGFVDRSMTHTGIGSWVQVKKEDSSVTLKKKEKRDINFTLTIPEKTPYGEYYGGLIAESIPAAEQLDTNIASVIQTGVRFILRVSEEPKYIAKTPFAKKPFNQKLTEYLFVSAFITIGAILLVSLLQFKELKTKTK